MKKRDDRISDVEEELKKIRTDIYGGEGHRGLYWFVSTFWEKVFPSTRQANRFPNDDGEIIYLDRNGIEIRIGDLVKVEGRSINNCHGKIRHIIVVDLLPHELKSEDDPRTGVMVNIGFDKSPDSAYEGKIYSNDFWCFNDLTFRSGEDGDKRRKFLPGDDGEIRQVLPIRFAGFEHDDQEEVITTDEIRKRFNSLHVAPQWYEGQLVTVNNPKTPKRASLANIKEIIDKDLVRVTFLGSGAEEVYDFDYLKAVG